MRLIVIIALSLLIFSCRHDSSNDNSLTGHYWICDSVRITVSGVGATTITGANKGLDVEYSTNGYYTVHAYPDLIKNYLKKGDTLFYWSPPNSMDPNSYSIIKSLSNKKMHLWERDKFLDKNIDYWHHYQ